MRFIKNRLICEVGKIANMTLKVHSPPRRENIVGALQIKLDNI